jgi:hypothetical protein
MIYGRELFLMLSRRGSAFRMLGMILAVTWGLWGPSSAQQGSPPEITFIDFPTQIQADGNPNSGYLFFSDPDGDVVKVRFTLVEGNHGALEIGPGWEFDPQVRGVGEGVIEFQVATRINGIYRLQAVLEDEAGHRSDPWEIEFEAVGGEEPPGSGPILQVSPSQLSFRGPEGEPIPPQPLTLTNVGEGMLHWQAEDDRPWIVLSATQGSLAAGQSTEMRVFVQSSGLGAGTHRGTITITAPGAEGSPARIPVSLQLDPKDQRPILVVEPTSLSFRAEVGGSNPAAQTLRIRNEGAGTLSWRASSNVRWLSLHPSSGTLTTGSTTVRVSVTIRDLSAGTYRGQITVEATGAENSPQTVQVTLRVEEQPPRLVVSPTSLSFRTISGTTPSAQRLTIRNGGGGTLRWRASRDVSWLILRPTSGSLTTGTTTVTVSVSLRGLRTGTHSGRITITAEGARGSPQVIPVTLRIESPASRCGTTIFFDDFSDPDSGWSEGVTSSLGTNWGYTEDEEYRVLVTRPHVIAWSWAPMRSLRGNFCLEADVKQLVRGALNDKGEMGIIFGGDRDERTYKLFGIRYPERAYHIGHFSPDTWVEDIVRPTRSSAIRGVNRFNHLLIIVQGSRASFYINDVHVKTLTIDTAGSVGFFVLSFDEPNINGHFDNFSVKRLR